MYTLTNVKHLIQKSIEIVILVIIFMVPVTAVGQEQATNSYVQSASWSPDGSMIAVSGSLQGKPIVNIYNTDYSAIYTLTSDSDIYSLVWSPDSTKIATLVSGDFIQIWDVGSQSPSISILQEGGTNTYKLQWTGDGKYIIGSRSFVTLWNTTSGEQVYSFQPDTPEFVSTVNFDFNPSTNQILIADSSNTLRLWDLSTGKLVQSVTMDHFISSIAHSPDGSKFAFTLSSGQINIVEATDISTNVLSFESGQELHTQLPAVSFVRWAENNIIAVAGVASDISIYDSNKGQVLNVIPKVTDGFTQAIELSPSGGQLIYSSIFYDGSPRVTPTKTETFTRTLFDDALQIIVPIATFERFAEIAASCNAPASLVDSTLQTDAVQAESLLTQLDALSEGAIPVGCEADLRAIAEAIQAKGE